MAYIGPQKPSADAAVQSIDIAALQIHQEGAPVEDTPPIPRDEVKADSAANTCYFLDKIPGELRNRIYEYALVGQDGEAVLKYCILVPTSPAFTEEELQKAKRTRLEDITESVCFATRQLGADRTNLEEVDSRISSLEAVLQTSTEDFVSKSDATHELPLLRRGRSVIDRRLNQWKTFIAGDEQMKQQILSGEFRVEPAQPQLPAHESTLAVDDGLVKKKREAFRDENNVFALSRTCSQIHEECSGLIYEYNKIKFVTMPFSNRTSSTDLQLEYIAARQSKSAELQQGVIIDVGDVNGTSKRELESFIDTNQDSLRKLRKSCKSLALHFRIQDVRWRGDRPLLHRDPMACQLAMDSPEYVVSQIDAMLVAESQRLDAERLWSIKTKLIKTFWPLWAVLNLL